VHQNERNLVGGCYLGEMRVEMESADVIDDLRPCPNGFPGDARLIGID